ncbi:hypothetical protein H1S01_14660 [Heliobacterium chlorum]|uniref:Methionine synthase n=1 Tax=Heliobacterium chlorum TaxID=2698 RepID=A0ABR7T4Y3_HELCL|nr:hypothetical protein [Heliobacterium chlorum]MBC9785731.1 hypothetical protein [Heliobacterium chlorum]
MNIMITGMGSLPYESYEEAKALIARCCPEILHSPQLPEACREDQLLEQALAPWDRAGLIRRLPDGTAIVDRKADGFDEALRQFKNICEYGECGVDEPIEWFSNDESLFAQQSPNYRSWRQDLRDDTWPIRPSWLKVQMAGPLTAALFVKDEEGKPLFDDPQLRELMLMSAAHQATWVGSDLRQYCWPAMVFIDEPGLYTLGKIEYPMVTAEIVREFIETMTEALSPTGTLSGVHCCGNTDWSLMLTSPIHIISFDASQHFESFARHPKEIGAFLFRGGLLAWGIVPTDPEELAKATAESLQRKLQGQLEALEKAGVSGDALRRQIILTPACGYGLRSADDAEKGYTLLRELGELMDR